MPFVMRGGRLDIGTRYRCIFRDFGWIPVITLGDPPILMLIVKLGGELIKD